MAALKEERVIADFQKMAQSIPNSLRRQGYEDFGRLRLSELQRSMQTFRGVKVTGWFNRPEPVLGKALPTARSTARWSRQQGVDSIEVNGVMWPRVKADVKPVIALHEYLGLEGFRDQQYKLSTALWLLSRPEAKGSFSQRERGQLVAMIEAEARSGDGGIIGVGGGGDISGVTTKMGLLQRDLRVLSRSQGEARNRALRSLFTNFELLEEARWESPDDRSADYFSLPAEKFDDANLFRLCQLFLESSSASQQKTFAVIQKTQPEIARRLRSAQGLKKLCQNHVRGVK